MLQPFSRENEQSLVFQNPPVIHCEEMSKVPVKAFTSGGILGVLWHRSSEGMTGRLGICCSFAHHDQHSPVKIIWKKLNWKAGRKFEGSEAHPWALWCTTDVHFPNNLMNTLPEPNSSPLKINGWKLKFLLGRPIIRGYVSFREGRFTNQQEWWDGMEFQTWHQFWVQGGPLQSL